MKQARQIDYFEELFNQDGNELFLLSLNGDTHTMSLNTIKQYCITDLVTGGTYNSSTGVVTFTNVNGGTFSVSGFKTDDITLTGGTYSNGTITFENNTGGTFSVSGLYTGNTEVYVTGGTYNSGTAMFTNNTGGTFNVDGFFTGSTALSDLGFSISALPTKIIYQNVSLPEDSYITYNSPLVIAGGYNLTIPSSTILQVIEQVGSESNVNNISDAIYTVNKNLNANNTSTATTSVMVYGVNVFTGVTPTNFATKLPQPVTGKSVKVINNGSTLLHIFPSNIGGRINNLPIDNAAVIPPDGNLYEFICIENPLPGAWTFSAPATGQYDSGEITMSATSIGVGSNPVVTAYDSDVYGMIQTFFNGTVSYNGKNKPARQVSPSFIINGSNPYNRALFFRPETPWKGIAKIKMYTNLIPVIVDEEEISYGEIRLMGSGYYTKYIADTGEEAGGDENSTNELFVTNLSNRITGSASTGTTIYTSANIGDPGTIWGEKVANADSYSNVSIGSNVEGTFIGNKSIETTLYSGSNSYLQGKMIEKYYSSYISFQFNLLPYINYGTIPDFKFRFIIEYYQ